MVLQKNNWFFLKNLKIMIIRIIKWILKAIFWQLIFKQINRINFLTLFQWFTTQFLALSFRDSTTVLRDLVSDRITNNKFYRALETTFGLQVRLLFDRTSNNFFWIGLVFSLLFYRWFVLLKNFLIINKN